MAKCTAPSRKRLGKLFSRTDVVRVASGRNVPAVWERQTAGTDKRQRQQQQLIEKKDSACGGPMDAEMKCQGVSVPVGWSQVGHVFDSTEPYQAEQAPGSCPFGSRSPIARDSEVSSFGFSTSKCEPDPKRITQHSSCSAIHHSRRCLHAKPHTSVAGIS